MTTAWTYRRYLLKAPKPSLVRLTVRGVVQEIKIGRGAVMSRIADTIEAVAPDVLECFDEGGTLLRAMRPDADTELGSAQPKPPTAINADPETLRLNHFASLLAKAYEHSTQVAFSKLVELAERMEARMESVETRLERTETAYRRTLHQQLLDARDEALDAAERAGEDSEGGEDMAKQMFGAFLQGKMQGAARKKAAATSPPPNGNGKA
jgi:hypothetical protein